MIESFPGRKVIFNKNVYYGFQAFQSDEQLFKTYSDPSVAAVFAVSEHNRSHLAFTFPESQIFRVVYSIDCEVFSYNPMPNKKPIIACVAKDLPQLDMLRKIISARNCAGLNDFGMYEWLLLKGYDEGRMASTLRDAVLVISLSTKEGLSRTIREAMACGCLVLVPAAGAAMEDLPQHAHVEVENLMDMVTKIEDIMRMFLHQPDQLAALSLENCRYATSFTYQRSREHILRAWQEILRED
ncbi:hypothetical protein [Edaphobacter dinghuensis]|nr:hypothetical protein [Edaphobacter dinghuensis]